MVAEVLKPGDPQMELLGPNQEMSGVLWEKPIQIIGTVHAFFTRRPFSVSGGSDTTYSTGDELVLDDGTRLFARSNEQPFEPNPLYDAAV